jgi:hypothetical protein
VRCMLAPLAERTQRVLKEAVDVRAYTALGAQPDRPVSRRAAQGWRRSRATQPLALGAALRVPAPQRRGITGGAARLGAAGGLSHRGGRGGPSSNHPWFLCDSRCNSADPSGREYSGGAGDEKPAPTRGLRRGAVADHRAPDSLRGSPGSALKTVAAAGCRRPLERRAATRRRRRRAHLLRGRGREERPFHLRCAELSVPEPSDATPQS